MEWGCPRCPSCSRTAHNRNVLGERAQLRAPRPAPSFVEKIWDRGGRPSVLAQRARSDARSGRGASWRAWGGRVKLMRAMEGQPRAPSGVSQVGRVSDASEVPN